MTAQIRLGTSSFTILHRRRLEWIFLSQGNEVGRISRLLFESLRYRRGGFNLLSLSYD
jgi:hypothetical protein